MAKILVLLTVLVSTQLWAKAPLGSFKTGDILLQPLKCWSCSLIEQQEKSDYAHIGMLVKKDGQDFVLEAYMEVRLIPLAKFLEKTHPDKRVKVLRLSHSTENLTQSMLDDANEMLGNPYDANFLWDNFVKDKESLYCSELLYKVLRPYIYFIDLAPKKMLFDVNPKAWDRYFRGNTPRGKLGISPEDFNLSSDFQTVFWL